jgi:hypothetical protein
MRKVQSTAWGLVSGAGACRDAIRGWGAAGTGIPTVFTAATKMDEVPTGMDGTEVGADLPDETSQHGPAGVAAETRVPWADRCAIIGQP